MTATGHNEAPSGAQVQAQAGGGEGATALAAFWAAHRPEVFAGAANWTALSGGRTNAVWRVQTPAGALVVKLYRADAATPLFANDPEAEAASLAALAGTGLAPDLVATALTPQGPSLVYSHIAGRPWQAADNPSLVAEALARLHARALPDGLPMRPPGADRLRAEALAMLDDLGPQGAALAALRPGALPDPGDAPPAFIHGDATAANALVTGAGLTFIDWQCPGGGDAADDLAVFLSPAMQAVSGNAPLTAAGEAAFLASYQAAGADHARTVARYHARAPLYHWRMAAYATWRAARGDDAYAAAAALETARLKAAK
ncbi:aminoglycoside phosphotransferase family protein [Sinisalibacter aestuarii]|uniref:Aminoglycoside phosphotransferase domain-containing protein n=1 Tax=Sinisalibacter aestuarii TaxID=2949426 RepID=A0ABQ5LNW9_9RHOB|nr:aminoglycoside phosphotransferase family protein [Sinisalibacter aestuarii]GKY86704.1 hypothetical protein STA1M1_05730 [Sinisalibacter aestuarii]